MSHTEANKAIRVLSGERLKYTHRVYVPEQTGCIEFQSNEGIKVEYQGDTRCTWICYSGYTGAPIIEYKAGMIILTEINPGMEDKK